LKQLNEAFKALADPTRRQILKLLRDRNMTAGEIADQFQISKPSISHHLNLLKQAGLVSDERQGQNMVYSLHTTVMEDVLSWMFGILGKEDKEEDS
jgi:DNA-binding transcriptional ArsR family regulator